MCLSSIYKKNDDENVFLLKNVARVICKDDDFAFDGTFRYQFFGRSKRRNCRKLRGNAIGGERRAFLKSIL